MPIRLEELATHLGATVWGEASLVLRNALPLHDAGDGDLTLLDSTKNLDRYLRSQAAAAVVPLRDAEAIFQQSSKPVLGVPDVHTAFIRAIELLRGSPNRVEAKGISPQAVVDPTLLIEDESSVFIGPHATIGPNCRIARGCRIHAGVHLMGDCRIGADCEIYPGCVLYPGTILGARVLLHAGAVLGAYGFGYKLRNGRHERTAQMGWVEIDDDVEIGANTTIDRGTYGPTRIGAGTKLDNQVQIGHNVHLGRHNLMCAQVGIAGSSSTGDYVVLGGQAGVRDHIHLADHSMVAAQSGLSRDLEPHESVFGSPALPSREATQIWIASQRLPEMKKQLRELSATVAALEGKLASSPATAKAA